MAACRIKRNGANATGSLAKRFRSASATAYSELTQVIRVNSASWSKIWLAPVVEAAPAMRTSASQKTTSRRDASNSTSPATRFFRCAAGTCQEIFDRKARGFPQTLDFAGQLGNNRDFGREQYASIKVENRQAIAIIETVLGAKFRRKS